MKIFFLACPVSTQPRLLELCASISNAQANRM